MLLLPLPPPPFPIFFRWLVHPFPSCSPVWLLMGHSTPPSPENCLQSHLARDVYSLPEKVGHPKPLIDWGRSNTVPSPLHQGGKLPLQGSRETSIFTQLQSLALSGLLPLFISFSWDNNFSCWKNQVLDWALTTWIILLNILSLLGPQLLYSFIHSFN